MQSLTYLRIGTSRFYRVVDIFQSHKTQSIKRCLSNKSKNENDNAGLYKPSTAKQETHVPDEIKGGQTTETTQKSTATLTGGGKVWSAKNPESVHIAPLGAAATTFIPTTLADGKASHETTVYSTQGNLNFADPFKTHTLQPEATPAQLAQAAAASAFEPFAPNTPLTSAVTLDTVFAPKISSTDVYSKTASPTAHFQTGVSSSSLTPPQDTTKYETSGHSKVFGGQDTSASSKKHPQEDPFGGQDTLASIKTLHKEDPFSTEKSNVNEIPFQRESDLRDNILRESLQYVDEKGWTMDAIQAGVRASNQPTTVEGLFNNGYDLVEYFMRDANAKMSVYMDEKSKQGDLQGTRLLTDGLKYRLGLVIPYARTWDQALAQGALPQNAMRGWKNLLNLSSDAWHGIGDTSTDINWYSKRLLLAAIYKSSEIYMLQDQSQDKIDTMNFLERRLSDFQTIGSVRNSVSKSLSDTAQIASGLFSVVRNMTSRR